MKSSRWLLSQVFHVISFSRHPGCKAWLIKLEENLRSLTYLQIWIGKRRFSGCNFIFTVKPKIISAFMISFWAGFMKKSKLKSSKLIDVTRKKVCSLKFLFIIWLSFFGFFQETLFSSGRWNPKPQHTSKNIHTGKYLKALRIRKGWKYLENTLTKWIDNA